MNELIGHWVAYRKLVSRSPSALLPENQFGLYGVCARFPQQLSGQVPWQPVKPGVYDCLWGTNTIRVLVAGELSREPQNAPLHLFSASPELVGFGGRAYQRHSENTSGLLDQLFDGLEAEGFAMPYTMEDFRRQYVKEHFSELTRAEREDVIKSLPPEKQDELLQALPPEKRLAGLSAEQKLTPKEQEELLQALPPEKRLAGLSAENRLAGLSAEQIRQYLDRLSAKRPAAPRKGRRKP